MTDMICKNIIDDYIKILRDGIEVEQSNGEYIVSLPFLSWSGHYLEIHVRQLMGDYVALSDGEHEIADLWLSGMSISGRNRNIIRDIAVQYDVRLEGDEIIAKVPLSKAGETVHRLVQAFVRIGDISLLHRIIPVKETPLKRRVGRLLKRSKIDFITGPRATVNGQISKGYELDFLVLNGRKSAIKTIEAKRALKTRVEAFAFEFGDIKAANPAMERIGVYDKNNEQWDDELLKIAGVNTERILSVQEENEILSLFR